MTAIIFWVEGFIVDCKSDVNWKIRHFEQLSRNKLYKILRKRIDVFVVEQECPYPECDGKDRDAFHIYALDDDTIVAYARIIKPGVSYQETSIGRVLVDQAYRGKGLGRKVMEKSIQFIREEMNEDQIRISAQEYLLDFYREMGFQKQSDVYLEDGIPHIEMLYQA